MCCARSVSFPDGLHFDGTDFVTNHEHDGRFVGESAIVAAAEDGNHSAIGMEAKSKRDHFVRSEGTKRDNH